MDNVVKHGMIVPVSEARLADERPIVDELDRWMSLPPEQRRAEMEANAKRLKEERKTERETTPQVPLTAETLVAAFAAKEGWSREYLEHLVQPYCRCESGMDGWEYCDHARDLKLTV
jgi:hypothetical protein